MLSSPAARMSLSLQTAALVSSALRGFWGSELVGENKVLSIKTVGDKKTLKNWPRPDKSCVAADTFRFLFLKFSSIKLAALLDVFRRRNFKVPAFRPTTCKAVIFPYLVCF